MWVVFELFTSSNRERVKSLNFIPETIYGCKVTRMPNVKGGTEDVRLTKFIHLTLSVTNLLNKVKKFEAIFINFINIVGPF